MSASSRVCACQSLCGMRRWRACRVRRERTKITTFSVPGMRLDGGWCLRLALSRAHRYHHTLGHSHVAHRIVPPHRYNEETLQLTVKGVTFAVFDRVVVQVSVEERMQTKRIKLQLICPTVEGVSVEPQPATPKALLMVGAAPAMAIEPRPSAGTAPAATLALEEKGKKKKKNSKKSKKRASSASLESTQRKKLGVDKDA